MVVDISAWGHKLSAKMSSLAEYTPDMFLKSQWQRTAGVSAYYVVYRCVFACLFLAVLVYSVVDRSSEDAAFVGSVASYYAKWFIYLTHWGFTLCTVQAVLGAMLVLTERHLHIAQDQEVTKMSASLRVYWVLHNCAVVAAFTITTIYWLFVYNPDEMKINVLNLSVHAGNSIFMLLDLIVVAFPVRLIDFYWPLLFSALYTVFNVIYYLAGGTDRLGRRYIYTILDWTKPGQTIVVLVLANLYVLFLHIVVSGLSVARRRVSERWRRRQTDLQGVTNQLPISDFA